MRDERGRFSRQQGQYLDSKGYWCYSAGPDRGQRVHRVIARQLLGTALTKDIVVHHANGDKLDNRPENLVLMGERAHNAVSAKQRWYLKQHDIQAKKEWESYFDEAEDVSFDTEKFNGGDRASL